MAQRLGRAEAGYAARGSSLICDSRPAAPCCLGGSTTGSGAEQPLQTTAHGQLLGQFGHWPDARYQAAMRRSAVIARQVGIYVRFVVRATAGPDPLPSFVTKITGRQLTDCCGHSERGLSANARSDRRWKTEPSTSAMGTSPAIGRNAKLSEPGHLIEDRKLLLIKSQSEPC